MAQILIVDHHKTSKEVLIKLLESEHSLHTSSTAEEAINKASNQRPDIIILELSLAGHSGLEFLYEFRTYADWLSVPVIVYTQIHLDEEVLKSRAWQQLDAKYMYKPTTTLEQLKIEIEKMCSAAVL